MPKCSICGTEYSGEGSVKTAQQCGGGKMPHIAYKPGSTYVTGRGGRLEILSTRIVLWSERHIRLYRVHWVRGTGKSEMTFPELGDLNLQGVRKPGGLDIDVPAGARFHITRTSGAGTNKRYLVVWKDRRSRNQWMSKAEVLSML